MQTTTPVRNFRVDRVSAIIAGRASVPLWPGLHTILHIIPFKALDCDSGFGVTLSNLHQQGQLQPLFTHFGCTLERNVGGYINHNGSSISGITGSYLQVFRNGSLESVNTLPHRSHALYERQIPSLELELQLLRRLPSYFGVMKNLGVHPPVAVGISLTGVEGYSMELPLAASPARACRRGRRIKNDTLFLPEALVTDFDCDLALVLKPVFDAAWMASGWERSIFYKKWEWVGLARHKNEWPDAP
jgi:hypothetical protein